MFHIEKLKNEWKKYDPDATGLINVSDLGKFLTSDEIEIPFKFKFIERVILKMHLPLFYFKNQ